MGKWKLYIDSAYLGEFDTESECMRAGDEYAGKILEWGITPEGHRYSTTSNSIFSDSGWYQCINPFPEDENYFDFYFDIESFDENEL